MAGDLLLLGLFIVAYDQIEQHVANAFKFHRVEGPVRRMSMDLVWMESIAFFS